MYDVIVSILIMFCAIILFYLSWRLFLRNKIKYSVVLVILGGLVLRIYTSFDFYLHEWDERYHALVAKNLIKHPLKPTLYDNPVLPYEYKNWTANHIWLHKQPMPLWIMALSMWLFGINEIALRLPSILVSSLAIYLTFYIGTYLFNIKVGYLSSLLFAINGLIIELTAGRVATDHVDIFFLFFIELAIYFNILYLRNQKLLYLIMAGISIGSAILTKWLIALIIFPIWFLLALDSNKYNFKQILFQIFILLLVCIMVFIPWQIYTYIKYPKEFIYEMLFNLKHFTEVLEERTGSIFYYLNKIRINYGELIYLPILYFLWKLYDNITDKKRIAIFVWIFIPIIIFSFAKTKMQGFILFTSPALFMITSEFFFNIFNLNKKYNIKRILSLIQILIIVLPFRYMIERIKPFNTNRNPKWVKELKKINYTNGILFNYEKPIEAMFYTNLIVYSHIPDKLTIKKLISEGHSVYLYDNGNLPNDIKSIKEIRIIKF